ncbi:hypothetical protein HOD83_03445 [Candidatus Woesearchaeota archaeon]|jgi:hypothetical protein|nr:hypothetical protein [Candidatus Woesearchaeota archaeon]MBT4114065.1 hypothetical protein [Candidatus Woesearchaeota archaeon]MBT4248609.1 hypothetical protein [Candidatus Woesearchaeota archaeon]
MGLIPLDAWKLTFEVENIDFRDDGVVKSIVDQERKYYLELGGDPDKFAQKQTTCEDMSGYFHAHSRDNDIFVRICVKDQSNPVTILGSKAHEQAHVIHLIERLDVVDDRLAWSGFKNRVGRTPPLVHCSHYLLEFVANVSSLLLLHERGYNLSVVRHSGPEKHIAETAKQVLLQNYVPSKDLGRRVAD